MNLLAQLELASSKRVIRPKPSNYEAMSKQGHELKTLRAIQRYREVMDGRGWLTLTQIEHALGYTSTISTGFIRKLWQKHGLVERRNRGGAERYVRTLGYEWRWKDGA